MPRKGQKLTAEQRQKISESRKHLTPEQRENMAAAQRGKTIPPETRAKMSAKHMGHPVSPEARAAIGNAHRGKSVSEESREKNRQAHLGRVASESTREKMSGAHAGKVMSEDFCQRVRAGLLGKPKTELHCQNMSEGKKGTTPANIEILKQSRIGSHTNHTEEAREKMSQNRSGKCMQGDNPNWNGGTSFFPYCHKFNNTRRKAVRKFFGHICIICGKRGEDNVVGGAAQGLSVHHIDHDKEQGCSGRPFNLVPLCASCHAYEMHNQEEYKLRINKILDEGFASGRWSRETYEREVMYPEESNEA